MLRWFAILENSLFPPTCLLCDSPGEAGKDICGYCLKQLLVNKTSCYCCGQNLEQNTQLCSQCLKKPPDYQRTVAPFIYQKQGVIGHLIKRLKFDEQYKNAKLLGTLFAEQFPSNTKLPECIIPVPLHKNRYRERGFNQSQEIARTVAKHLKIPLELNLCIRHRDTPHQVSLPAKQRGENIKEAFSLVKPMPYSHVAVFDDVMTTGSTVAEITRVLKKAGVQTVEVWVCARTD